MCLYVQPDKRLLFFDFTRDFQTIVTLCSVLDNEPPIDPICLEGIILLGGAAIILSQLFLDTSWDKCRKSASILHSPRMENFARELTDLVHLNSFIFFNALHISFSSCL
jgi:hypothetical protein